MENVLKQNLENELLWRKTKEWEQQEGLVTALFRILPILHESTITSAEQNVPAEMSCVQSDEGKIMKNKICWSVIKNERGKIWENKTKKQCYTHSPFSRFLKIPIFFQYSNTVKIRLLSQLMFGVAARPSQDTMHQKQNFCKTETVEISINFNDI